MADGDRLLRRVSEFEEFEADMSRARLKGVVAIRAYDLE
jgi:hypothetical protein